MGKRKADEQDRQKIDWKSSMKISFQKENPKRSGSSAFSRYKRYSIAGTVGEALEAGASLRDLDHDHQKSYLTISDEIVDSEGEESCDEEPLPLELPHENPESEDEQLLPLKLQPENAQFVEDQMFEKMPLNADGSPKQLSGSPSDHLVGSEPHTHGVDAAIQTQVSMALTCDTGVQTQQEECHYEQLTRLTHEVYALRTRFNCQVPAEDLHKWRHG